MDSQKRIPTTTARRLADVLGISESSMARLKRSGTFDLVQVGRRREITIESVDRYLREYRQDLLPEGRAELIRRALDKD